MTELLLLHEQARSLGELTLSYSQTLAECAQGGQMFGESLNKLAYKRDPRTETLWETSWHALSLEQVVLRGGQQGAGAAAAPAASAPEGAAEGVGQPLPSGLSTIQQLLYTLGLGQAAAHARLMELAESSHMLVHKALDALKEQYRADVKGINDKYMESKRRWRYSLSQAVAHRHSPEEASRFESEAAAWRRQWEGASGELVEAARRVKNEHAPRVRPPARPVRPRASICVRLSLRTADYQGVGRLGAAPAEVLHKGWHRAAAGRVQTNPDALLGTTGVYLMARALQPVYANNEPLE